jgi:uncharacterized hydrophobic protein (TIGR00271 family)
MDDQPEGGAGRASSSGGGGGPRHPRARPDVARATHEAIRRRARRTFDDALRLVRDEDVDAWRDLARSADEQSVASSTFHVLVALSAAVAAGALLADNGAAVVGAVLVGPVATPVLPIAFALAAGDRALLGRAAITQLTAAALSIAVALAVGLLFDHLDVGSEVLRRTRVQAYDPVVAFGVGLAAVCMIIDGRVSPALPGAAMGLVIVPPLVSVGLCLAARRPDAAGGAFRLFLTNLAAIALAGAGALLRFGHRSGRLRAHSRWRPFVRQFGACLALAAIVGATAARTLIVARADRRQRRAVLALLDAYARVIPGTRVASLTVGRRDDSLSIHVALVGSRVISPREIASMEARLRSEVDATARLAVRSVVAAEHTAADTLLIPMP